MPIYEYECERCGELEEAIQKVSDPPLIVCRHCSGALHRLVSRSSFHLKGTGWYVTDYAKKSNNSASPVSTPSETGNTGSKTAETPKNSTKAD
jgi:putative FmdB family regulatory protein